ncbi:TlpA family protein disulfide reductase [Pseudofulvibacter geojedonensis]|uniref:TlpA family protein disulfide reductase n=1 Tax=Pseudofulvibacter geojedonensis TaxID=1123758 RepID=A0ABW3I0U9_9FLAO
MKNLIAVFTLFICSFVFPQKKLADVSLLTLEGNKVSTESITKNSVVVVALWSTKCPPCKKELNNINKIHEEWKMQTGVPFYAVSIDKKQDASKVVDMAKKSNWSFSVLLDQEKKLRKALGVWTVPLTLVIKNNKIVYRQIGYSNGAEKQLFKAIKKHTTNKKYASL